MEIYPKKPKRREKYRDCEAAGKRAKYPGSEGQSRPPPTVSFVPHLDEYDDRAYPERQQRNGDGPEEPRLLEAINQWPANDKKAKQQWGTIVMRAEQSDGSHGRAHAKPECKWIFPPTEQ